MISDTMKDVLHRMHTIKPTMQLTGFFRGNFEDEVYTYRLGLTIFL